MCMYCGSSLVRCSVKQSSWRAQCSSVWSISVCVCSGSDSISSEAHNFLTNENCLQKQNLTLPFSQNQSISEWKFSIGKNENQLITSTCAPLFSSRETTPSGVVSAEHDVVVSRLGTGRNTVFGGTESSRMLWESIVKFRSRRSQMAFFLSLPQLKPLFFFCSSWVYFFRFFFWVMWKVNFDFSFFLFSSLKFWIPS